MRHLAVWIRGRARETGWPEYGWKMRHAARDLEKEARELDRAGFYAALFNGPHPIIFPPA